MSAVRHPHSVDWQEVESVVHHVRHHYRYVYTGPIHDLKQRLVMVPPDHHADQDLLVHDLEVRGASGDVKITWERDTFGNRICLVEAERVERAVDFEATFRVRRRAAPPQPRAPKRLSRRTLADYLAFTSLTAPDKRLRAVAEEIRAEAPTLLERAERAHDWAAQAIRYQIGVTGVQTPAAMALHFGAGVCQDYAHLMLSVLRALGVPCRYVCGHLLGEGAPHAWVEVLLPHPRKPVGLEVIAYDPTHHRRAGLSYITVATGRDFADTTMTSGVFSGAASGKLHWSKQAETVELEWRHGKEAAEGAVA